MDVHQQNKPTCSDICENITMDRRIKINFPWLTKSQYPYKKDFTVSVLVYKSEHLRTT